MSRSPLCKLLAHEHMVYVVFWDGEHVALLNRYQTRHCWALKLTLVITAHFVLKCQCKSYGVFQNNILLVSLKGENYIITTVIVIFPFLCIPENVRDIESSLFSQMRKGWRVFGSDKFTKQENIQNIPVMGGVWVEQVTAHCLNPVLFSGKFVKYILTLASLWNFPDILKGQARNAPQTMLSQTAPQDHSRRMFRVQCMWESS